MLVLIVASRLIVLGLSSSVSSHLRFAELLIEIETQSSGMSRQTCLDLLDLTHGLDLNLNDIAWFGRIGRYVLNTADSIPYCTSDRIAMAEIKPSV